MVVAPSRHYPPPLPSPHLVQAIAHECVPEGKEEGGENLPVRYLDEVEEAGDALGGRHALAHERLQVPLLLLGVATARGEGREGGGTRVGG